MILGGVRRRWSDYDIGTHFTPRYNPGSSGSAWCRTATIQDDPEKRASVVTSQIDTFTRNGIRLKDGSELKADIIVTATASSCRCSAASRSASTAVADFQNVELQGTYSDVPNMASAFGHTNAS
jgi:cation diffusion facilitator CzcD-associated flavoprotein CzcO